MASRSKSRLSLLEKLDLLPAILQLVAKAFLTLFTAAFRGKDGAPTFYKHVVYTAFRSMLKRTSIRQSQYLTPCTDDVYLSFAKAKRFPPSSEVLADGTKAHWLGDKSAEKVIVYFHGGGFVMPANEGQFKFLWGIMNMLNEMGKSVAVLVLSYDVAPAKQYPHQLRQSVELLRHVVDVLKKESSNIILAGDSAGGNLALGVLSHLSHPHPSIPPLVFPEGAKLKGAILISPWASFGTYTHSFGTNRNKDVLDGEILTRWASAFIGGATVDPYNQPATAPAAWWRGVKADEVLVLAGGDEVFVDDVEAVGAKIKSVHPATTVVTVPGEAHDQAMLDIMLGYKEQGEGMKTMKKWIESKL